MWGDIAIAFMIAFMTAFMATPHTIRNAKKIGAVDTPKDIRRINKITMPRLRRFSSYCWIFCINYLFVNYYEY